MAHLVASAVYLVELLAQPPYLLPEPLHQFRLHRHGIGGLLSGTALPSEEGFGGKFFQRNAVFPQLKIRISMLDSGKTATVDHSLLANVDADSLIAVFSVPAGHNLVFL
jgi:hypothetical protein